MRAARFALALIATTAACHMADRITLGLAAVQAGLNPLGGGGTMSDAGPSKTVLKTAARYRGRIAAGDLIVRDAAGRMNWQSSGRPVAPRTVRYMIEDRQIFERDADIFGDFAHGQTIGKELSDG